jgi:thymidylate synthase (FAD)
MISSRDVLDHGKVSLVDYMGDDYRILESARISTGSEPKKGDDKDRGLIRYLYKNQHMSPFEQVVTTWRMKAPLFVIQQLLRHRTMAFNQMSSRYTSLPEEWYTPEMFRTQSKTNHQGSDGSVPEGVNLTVEHMYNDHITESFQKYKFFSGLDVANEQSRMVLPVSQYSELYFTVNLRNLFHFLDLRLHHHAQYEIRVYAIAILEMLKEIEDLKWSIEVFEEFRELSEAYQNAINRAGKNTSKLIDHLNTFSEK